MAAKNKYPLFPKLCQQYGLPIPEAEYRFSQDRRWRMDFAWPEYKVYLEVDGGIWINGGHSRGVGIIKDHEKQNTASIQGWRILKCQPKYINTIDTLNMVRDALYYSHRVTPTNK